MVLTSKHGFLNFYVFLTVELPFHRTIGRIVVAKAGQERKKHAGGCDK